MKHFILKYGEGNSHLCSFYNDLAFYCVAGKYLRIVSITEDKVKINKLTGKRDIYAPIPVSDDGEYFYLCEKIYSLKTGKIICKLEHKPPTETWLNAFFTDQYLYTPISPCRSYDVIKKNLITFTEVIIELGKEIYRNKNIYIAITDTTVTCREINTDIKHWSYELDAEFVEPNRIEVILSEQYVILFCTCKCRVLVLDNKTGEVIIYKFLAELLNVASVEVVIDQYIYNDRLYFLVNCIDKSGDHHRTLAYYHLVDKIINPFIYDQKLAIGFFVNKHGVFTSTDHGNPFVLNHDLDVIIYDPKLRGPTARVGGNDDFVIYGQWSGGSLVIDCS